MDRKQKSLHYMQKASNEIHQLKKRIEELESELNDKSIQLLKKDERIDSLENTLRLFYTAIERDEERIVKEKKHSYHAQLQQEKMKSLSPEEEKKLQFQNDMEIWRNKEKKRNHSSLASSAPIRPAPVSVPVPPLPSISASVTAQVIAVPVVAASPLASKERPTKFQRVTSGSNILQGNPSSSTSASASASASASVSPVQLRRKQVRHVVTEVSSLTQLSLPASPSKSATTSTPSKSVVRKTPASVVRSSPLITGSRTSSPARQPFAPVQQKAQQQQQQEAVTPSQQKPTMAKKNSSSFTPNSRQPSLYMWCKQSAAPYEVKDFTKSWSDGVALCQLLNNLRPGCLPTTLSQLKPEQGDKNIRMALDAAEKLGVSKLIDPEDFAKERNSMMTYLSQVYSVLRDQENQV
jgi:hypothetical protein